MHIYIYIYIYIWREREREADRQTDRQTERDRENGCLCSLYEEYQVRNETNTDFKIVGKGISTKHFLGHMKMIIATK